MRSAKEDFINNIVVDLEGGGKAALVIENLTLSFYVMLIIGTS